MPKKKTAEEFYEDELKGQVIPVKEFAFTEYGITIKATSYAEALVKFQKLQEEKTELSN